MILFALEVNSGGFDGLSSGCHHLAVHIVRARVNILERIFRNRVPCDVYTVPFFAAGHMPVVDGRDKILIVFAVMDHRFTMIAKGLRDHFRDLTQIVEHLRAFHVALHLRFSAFFVLYHLHIKKTTWSICTTSCLFFCQLYDDVCIDNPFRYYYNLFRYICTALHE